MSAVVLVYNSPTVREGKEQSQKWKKEEKNQQRQIKKGK